MSTPLLRFSEFDAAWVEMPLNDFAVRITQRNNVADQNVLTISAVNGLVTQTDYFNNSVASKDLGNYYLLQKGDFAYNKSYSNGYPWGAIKRLSNYETGVVSPLYICFRISEIVNHDFVSQMFESDKHHNELSSIAKEGARNHGLLNIGINDFFSITFSLPSLEEQQKIADFLSAVDEKIELLTKKKALLEKYKKGVMQQLFSQTIRFKDDDGNDFPEWEERCLGEITRIINGATPDTAVSEYWDGELNWFSPTEFKSKYLFESKERITELGVQNSSVEIIPKDSILFSSRGTVGQVAINKAKCGINQSAMAFIPAGSCYFEFLYYWIIFSKPLFIRLSAGSTFLSITKSELAKFMISLPSLPEQQKIADFLSAIDRKIDLVSQQIEKTKLFKKGLLQQMFV